MSKKILILTSFFAILFTVFIEKNHAEPIALKDGSVLMGEITSENQGTYTIRLDGGTAIQIRSEQIKNPPSKPKSLRFHGSNTIGEKLIPLLIETYAKTQGSTGQWVLGSKENESAYNMISPPENFPAIFEVKSHGSGTAFKSLESNETEIGMSSRVISQKELINLSKFGDMKAPSNEHVLALDGLAVIIHPSNPINSLTKQQVANIFSGKINNWAALGGNDSPIKVYARDDKSGTWDTFKHMILGDQPLTATQRFESSEELSNKVSNEINGIGFIGIAYIGKSKSISINTVCGLNYPPDNFMIKTEEYPLSRRLFLYTTSNNINKYIINFLDFTQTEVAQTRVASVNFVNLSIEQATKDSQLLRYLSAIKFMQDPAEIKKLVTLLEKANRLSVTFRFGSNGTELDNRAIHDIKRLAEFMKSEANKGKELILIGFSDSDGSYETNLKLSKQRAKIIADQILQHGISAKIDGFGEEAPVACNEAEEGKEKNRRVEAWII